MTRNQIALYVSLSILFLFPILPATAQSPRNEETPYREVIELPAYAIDALKESKPFSLQVPIELGDARVVFSPVVLKTTATVIHPDGSESEVSSTTINFKGTIHRSGVDTEHDVARISYLPGTSEVDGIIRIGKDRYYELRSISTRASGTSPLLEVNEVVLDPFGEHGTECGTEGNERAIHGLDHEPMPRTNISSRSSSAASGTLREIELGVEGDALYVARFSNTTDALNEIVSIINAVNGIQERDLGLTNTIVISRMQVGSDPYTSSDSSTLLSQFRSEWLSNVSGTYDNAQLFSGRDFEGSVIGRAWLNAMCGSLRFGVNQYYTTNQNSLKILVAHEQGHNLGSNHTDAGIMKPYLDSSATSYDQDSIDQIMSHVNAVSCLSEIVSNDPPVLAAIGDRNVNEGDTLQFQISATDPDNDSISYTFSPPTSNASINETTGAFSYSPAPGLLTCGDSSSLELTFIATDTEGNSDSETIDISISDSSSNQAPSFNNQSDITVALGATAEMQLSATDSDGDSYTFSSSDLPNNAQLTEQGSFSWNTTGAEPGDYDIDFDVTDCRGGSNSMSVRVSVTDNRPAVIDVKVNGADAAANILSTTAINTSFSLLARGQAGVEADVFIVFITPLPAPFDYISYLAGGGLTLGIAPASSGPLSDQSAPVLSNLTLPPGQWFLVGIVDFVPNGFFDGHSFILDFIPITSSPE